MPTFAPNVIFRHMAALAVLGMVALQAGQAGAVGQVTAFKQAVAETASREDALATYYRSTDFAGLWTGNSAEDRARREALFLTIDEAAMHGLAPERYDAPGLMRMLEEARTPRDLGRAEVEMSRVFLLLSRDLQHGILVPSRVDDGIKREVPKTDPAATLAEFTRSNPRAFLRALPPKTAEYGRLMREKARLERRLGAGGWGPTVPAGTLEPGASGPAVVALRNRLTLMGFLPRSASQTYDARMQQAVQEFQAAHGLVVDGTAGAATMAAINRPVEDWLKPVLVAMERERWLNIDRGDRHILVNITDFSARIVDKDKVTFETRAVVGANSHDRRTPEFSDEMEHMVINPYWHVPRSIVVKEYLPQMQRNRGAAGHIQLYNASGQPVNRANINFGAYNARTFPFEMKQAPSARNALGLVKFMFPNKYNIYLHDTPSKDLFNRSKRDFSHGCIRLQQPFDFAYALLARQEADPVGYFQRILKTGRNTQVDLKEKVPVHIIYRTAYTRAKGPTQYRDDVYGRDARIWEALSQAGVSLRAVQG